MIARTQRAGVIMPALVDLTGKRFGRLVVVERAPNIGRYTAWRCVCDCGNEIVTKGNSLQQGKTQSCGCIWRENHAKIHKTHGKSKTRLYRVWSDMKRRCRNKKRDDYRLYGGRGIRVCDEWSESYEAFEKWALENGYDESAPYGVCTLDRIDVNGNY